MPKRRRFATRDELIELLADHAHAGWIDTKREQGVTSRLSEWGEEFMRPYDELSERAKDTSRGPLGSVLDALEAKGVAVDALVKITVEEPI